MRLGIMLTTEMMELARGLIGGEWPGCLAGAASP
jgi:hypothetical protein